MGYNQATEAVRLTVGIRLQDGNRKPSSRD